LSFQSWPQRITAAASLDCDIEAVMKRMGYVTTIRHNAANDIVLRDNERMVSQLANARQEEVSSFRNEGAIDQVAERFLILCGFDDDPLEITEQRSNFTLFGKSRAASAPWD
jgi:hypothetical protein